MPAPIIGITTWRRPIPTQLGQGRPSHTIGVEYADAIIEAGGVPVLLPPSTDPAAIIDRLDGLLLSGGEDADPTLYGAEPEAGKSYSADRDEFESQLARLARERNLPTLAICRGLQVTNVAFGGSLVVDLPATDVHETVVDGVEQLHRRHAVRFAPESMLAKAYGTQERIVNTIHHQAVDRVAEGFVATAHANDGVIEAIEATDGWPLLAVQWHPEKLSEPNEVQEEQLLFNSFLQTVKASLEQSPA